jgi:hypothetical protein
MDKKNYAVTTDIDSIMDILSGVSNFRPEIKIIIVDTITAIENDMEMRDMKKAGYDEIHTCRIKTHLIAGNSLEVYTLQRSYEIWASVNV